MHTISEECQAWQEARLVSTGEVEVPRLPTGCREEQVQQEDEVKVVATAVTAEGSPGAQETRGRSGGGKQRKGRKAVQQKKAKA